MDGELQNLRLSPRRGYTYIEALIVAMVFGILTAMMVPSYRRATDAIRVRTATRVVNVDLRRAIAVAQSRHRAVDVWFDEETRGLVAQVRGDTAWLLRRVLTADDTEWRVDHVRLEPTIIHILPGGRVAVPSVVTLSTPSRDRVLAISPIGVVAERAP